jgi:hypothetical protein
MAAHFAREALRETDLNRHTMQDLISVLNNRVLQASAAAIAEEIRRIVTQTMTPLFARTVLEKLAENNGFMTPTLTPRSPDPITAPVGSGLPAPIALRPPTSWPSA